MEVKLYLDEGILDARDKLLKFYDQIPKYYNFKEVDKADFKEVKKRSRNHHTLAVARKDEILKECFTSIGAPLVKKRALSLTDSLGSEDGVREVV